MKHLFDYIKSRPSLNVSSIEEEAGIPKRTLRNAMDDKTDHQLPAKWVEPLTEVLKKYGYRENYDLYEIVEKTISSISNGIEIFQNLRDYPTGISTDWDYHNPDPNIHLALNAYNFAYDLMINLPFVMNDKRALVESPFDEDRGKMIYKFALSNNPKAKELLDKWLKEQPDQGQAYEPTPQPKPTFEIVFDTPGPEFTQASFAATMQQARAEGEETCKNLNIGIKDIREL